MSKRMLRWWLVVGNVTTVPHGGPVKFVAGTQDDSVVEFWTEKWDDCEHGYREYTVFGTGHPIPVEWEYAGTTPRTPLGLVWHLYSRPVQMLKDA